IRDFHVTGVQTCALPILQQGDVIVAVAGKEVSNYGEVQDIVREHEGPLKLTVERDGKEVPITVEVVQVKRPKFDPQTGNPVVEKIGRASCRGGGCGGVGG